MLPKLRVKNTLVFCTYSDPHTGIDEATLAGKTIRQYIEHFGYIILGECMLSESPTEEKTWAHKGKLGDIKGKPTLDELAKIKKDAKQLATSL